MTDHVPRRPLLAALRPALREPLLVAGLVVGAVCYGLPSGLRLLCIDPAISALRLNDGQAFAAVIGYLLLIAVGLGVGAYASEVSRRTLQDRLIGRLRCAALDNLLDLSMGFHGAARLGDITNRLTTDIEYTRGALRVVLGDFVQAPIRALCLVGACVVGAGWLSVLLLAVVPLMVLPTLRYGRRIRERERRSLEADADLTQSFQQAVTGIRQVKAFGAEAREEARFAGDAAAYRARKEAVIRHEARSAGTAESFYGVSAAFALVLGGFALARGWAELPELLVFGAAVVSLYQPLRSITKGAIVFQEAVSGLERVLALTVPRPGVADAPDARALDGFRDAITLQGVSFAYDDGTVALADLDLTIRRGETVVLTGPSGSGKSTLLDLILRVHDVRAGRVAIDGVDVRQATRASLCALMGVVTQDPFLFHASIADNIRYGRPDADDAAVERAARAANIHEEIAALPQGYATTVGERGVRLSGGQRQRITIARAILRDAPILLLAEALAAIDAAGRTVVEEALERLRAGRTTIAITHDLRGALVTKADTVVVLAEGRLVEQGPFDALSARDGGALRALLRGATPAAVPG